MLVKSQYHSKKKSQVLALTDFSKYNLQLNTTEIHLLIFSRLLLMNECWHLINDDILDATDIDKLMTEGLAPRYAWQGPLETGQLLGGGESM